MCRKMFSQTRIKWPDEEIHTDETFSQWMESIDWKEAAYKDLGVWDEEWLNTSRNRADVTGRWEGKGWIPKSRRLGGGGVVDFWPSGRGHFVTRPSSSLVSSSKIAAHDIDVAQQNKR